MRAGLEIALHGEDTSGKGKFTPSQFEVFKAITDAIDGLNINS